MAENNMEKPKNKNFANTASRISAIASSVMDLHVKIALQEVDREKRRLISGGIFLAIGSTLLLFVLICIHIIVYIFLTKYLKLKSSLKIPVSNGGIDCRWIKYLIR